jgi:hypothetical protein
MKVRSAKHHSWQDNAGQGPNDVLTLDVIAAEVRRNSLVHAHLI